MNYSGDSLSNSDDYVPENFKISPIFVVIELMDPKSIETNDDDLSKISNSSKKEVSSSNSDDLEIYLDRPGDGSAFLPGCLTDDSYSSFFTDNLSNVDFDYGLSREFISDYCSKSTNYDVLFSGNAIGSSFL